MNFLQRSYIGLFGHACCYSWMNCVLFLQPNPLMSFGLIDGYPHTWVYTALFVAIAGVLFALYFFSRNRITSMNVYLILAFISLCAYSFGYLSSNIFLRIFFMAVGFVSLKSLWDLFLPSVKDYHKLVWLPVVVCSVIIGLIASIDVFVGDIITVAILALSLLLSIPSILLKPRSVKLFATDRLKQKITIKVSRALVISVESFFLGLTAFLILQSFQQPTGMSFSHQQNLIIIACSFFLAGVLMIIDVARKKRFSQSFLIQLSAIGLVPCFYFLPIFNGFGVMICGCILLFIMIRHFNYALESLLRRIMNEKTLDFFEGSYASALHCFGFLFGFAFPNSIMTYFVSEMSMSIIGFCGAYAVVLAAIFLPALQRKFGESGAINSSGAFKLKAEEIADKYDLTPRQSEVFKLLYKGRNAEHIARILCISSSTAKTHIYSIYSKMGIHSQQELMNIIDSALVE